MRTSIQPSFSWLKAWGWSFLVFGLIALVVVGQMVWTGSIPVSEAWSMAARDWLPWAVVSPLLFRLVTRLPLERARWRLALPVHLLCGIVVVALYTWWGEVVLPPPRPPQHAHAATGETSHLGSQAHHRPWIFAILLFRVPIYLAVISVAHAGYFWPRGIGARWNGSTVSARHTLRPYGFNSSRTFSSTRSMPSPPWFISTRTPPTRCSSP